MPSVSKKKRDSNLELYRIIVMLLIIAHHYVVNSGLFEVLKQEPFGAQSVAMLIFGAWGKTGIDCFVMITGWFMCKLEFTWRKLWKLYLQIAFYAVGVYLIFCIAGHETFDPLQLVLKLFPVRSVAAGFTTCFLIFYMLIPFLNILVRNLNKRMHLILMMILLVVYTLLPIHPGYLITFNYVSWFTVLYVIASYMRFYEIDSRLTHRQWGIFSLLSIIIAIASVVAIFALYRKGSFNYYMPYFMISDSNKILALVISVSSFMWFKDLQLPYSRLINTLGAATFGVLLIHANSDTMRQWLWVETVDCVGHFGGSLLWTLGYAATSVLAIFIICAGIDWFRGKLIEPHLIKVVEYTIVKIANRYKKAGQSGRDSI